MTYTSPNFDTRDGQKIDMLVLHYTGMKTAQDALTRLCDPTSKVSAHYVVDEDGTIHPLVEESLRAWHAGVSYWRGHTNINQRSIGIEIVNPGHEFGYRPFPPAQMTAVEKLCRDILTRHDIPPRNVVAHSDIAPARKEDPGELFPWKTLAALGIGHWPSANATLAPASQPELTDFGYDPSNPQKATIAFQRRFRPANMDGIWDPQTAQLLAALLRLP